MTTNEHVIYVVFQSVNAAAIPVCWRPTYDEAMLVRHQLSTADTFHWVIPVSDVPAKALSQPEGSE